MVEQSQLSTFQGTVSFKMLAHIPHKCKSYLKQVCLHITTFSTLYVNRYTWANTLHEVKFQFNGQL
jgi:hypothetical protein